MNQKEAIELALEMHAECEKRDAKGGRVCYISRMGITGCCGNEFREIERSLS